jgi:hypothetical protein
MSMGTWRDRRACVGRTQTAVKAWPGDEEKCYMTNLPLRGLYSNYVIRVVSSIGCLHVHLERGWQPSLETLAHFTLAIFASYFP